MILQFSFIKIHQFFKIKYSSGCCNVCYWNQSAEKLILAFYLFLLSCPLVFQEEQCFAVSYSAIFEYVPLKKYLQDEFYYYNYFLKFLFFFIFCSDIWLVGF